MKSVSIFITSVLLIQFIVYGAENFSPPYSEHAGDSFKNLPPVKKGGVLYTRLKSNPRTLAPIITPDVESDNVVQLLHSPLMERDQETDEFFPVLAEKALISKDFKTVQFTLRKEAAWDDGTSITTDDVEFTFNTLMNVKTDSAPRRANMEGYHFEKVDERTFRIHLDHASINLMPTLAQEFRILQKKQFEHEPDFNKSKGILMPVTSGPYRVKNFSRDEKVELERKKEWWGWKLPQFKNLYNFDSIVYRIIPDQALAYEKFIKGEVDVDEPFAEIFGTRIKGTDQDKFGTSPESGKEMWATLHKTSMPAPYTFIGWNLKNPLFQSKRTRRALAMLLNYDEIIKKVFYGIQIRRTGPFGSLTQNTAPEQAKSLIPFDLKKGIEELKADGWNEGADGILEKEWNGKKITFKFSLKYNSNNPMRAKIAQMAQAQFKKAGIEVLVQAIEWNAYIDEINDRKFDAFVLGWGKGFNHPEARQLWHSKSYENKGSNHGGYSNPEVDRLIEQADTELNGKKRYKLMQKIGALIYDDQPVLFICELPGYLAMYHQKVKSTRWAMKYDDHPALWLLSQ